MASTDDENEVVPDAVSDYHFVDAKDDIVSFSELPVQWNENESSDANKKRIFLNGTIDNGLQKLYKQVTAWKYDLSKAKPEISVLSKENNWIKLQRPRKSFEDTIRTILITVHCLHFLRKKPEASGKALWDHLYNIFSLYEPRPSENDLIDHMDFISEAVKRDEVLAKSKFLGTFLKERPRKRNVLFEDARTTLKPSFIVDDMIDEPEADDFPMKETEDDDSDEESGLFDSVCAICDNGGELLCCEGKCLRSFHATEEAGSESTCIALGLSDEQVEEIQTFFCENCRHNKHQCFVCGKLGSSDKSSGAEVFRCSSATCGHFYHSRCVAKMLHRDSEPEAEDLQEKIAAGEPFTCPAHKCLVCKHGENEKEHDLQFAMCRRCPRSYHRKCLPRDIVFEDSEDEDIIARAWEGLLPKSRILIYCLKHEIDDEIDTPKRDHIKFPNFGRNKKQESLERSSSRRKTAIKEKNMTSEYTSCITSEKRRVSNLEKGVESSSPAVKQVDSSKKRAGMLSGAESSKKQKVVDTSQKPLKKTLSTKVNKSTKEESKPSIGNRLYALMQGTETDDKSRKDYTSVGEGEQNQTSKSLVRENSSLPLLDVDSKRRILAMMKDASSSVTLEEVKKEHKVPSTHAYSSRNVVDKTITLGKVEGSIEALRLALKKLEEGCSIEDAKAVCEPGVISQVTKWGDKLKVYLAPFLFGARYTSFGRHFTKEDKLKEIVDRLRWYVEDGDTIVDFCCGANEFSCLLKKRLDEMRKKCSYKNYDIMPTKNDFSFEKRDWMTVQPKELPPGKQLIMGLNPPFGFKASLANQFIDKALQFKPKLLILIVPPETQRLEKKYPYDLVWEDDELLSGLSFYLPGSVDIHNKQLDDWNVTTPPLYLWSRRDWTTKYKAIAQKHGHISRVRNELQAIENSDALDYLMENHELSAEIPIPLDNPPVKNEDPIKIEEKATASVTETRKEGLTRENGATKVKENLVHGNNKSSENWKRRNRGKGKGGRGSDEIPLEEKLNEWISPVHQTKALEMIPDVDFRNEDSRPLDRPVSKSHAHYDTGYGRTHEDDVPTRYNTKAELTYGRSDGRIHEDDVPTRYNTNAELTYGQSDDVPTRYNTNTELTYGRSDGRTHEDDVATRYKINSELTYGRSDGRTHEDDMATRYKTNSELTYGRSDVASLGPDYGVRPSEVQYPGYQRESIENNGYSRPYIEETNAKYGMEALSQRGHYLGGHDPGFSAPYGLLGSAADPSYNRMSTPMLQRYAPRLDELNYTRMNSLGPGLGPEPTSMGRGGFYDHGVPRPGFRPDSLGFAPGPYLPYSQNNSSGWLNE